MLGGVFLLPLAAITYKHSLNHYDLTFIGSMLWLAIPVSILAVQLWLYLLRDNPVKASFWLFLCPVFGYVIANAVMKEPNQHVYGHRTGAGFGRAISGAESKT